MDKQTEKPLTVSVLLNAFLDLPTKWALTADIVLSADNVALFQLLPLIMAHIQRASRLHDDREPLVRLLHVLRVRFASCRWLKLRFLILAHHPAFSGFWTYVPVHHSHAYTVARHVVKQLVADVQSLGNNNTESCALTHREKERNNVDALLTSASALLYFAETSLFHPTKGIRLRPILHHRVVMRSGFNGKQLVDAIIARVVDGNRSYAIAVAQKLLDIGIIYPVAARLPNFEDNCRAVYQCRRTVLRDDSDRRFCIFSADGIDLKSRDSSPDGSGRSSFHGIRRVEFRIPMDMVDFQSLDFWTKAVYTKKAEEGYHYDFRAVAHPFYSVGLAQGLHELKIINSDNGASDDDFEVSANSGEESNDDSGSSDCTSISTPTTSYPIVRDHGIVDWMQQSAIISSIVVLKVFSSLAHPKIIELRKPLEGGVLTSEDQFVSLLPHLFVKTGDNLMQDLGVQLMFRIFNHVWNASSHSTQPYRKPPYCVTYEVMPTSASDGLMQAVTGLTSLKDFDWKLWAEKFGADEDRITDMLRSAVGSYIGTYTLGGRDRHFDNIMIQDDRFLLHIDFSYVLGRKPPVDGPPISISSEMEDTFRHLKIWNQFVSMCVDAFTVLREQTDALIRNTVTLFEKAGHKEEEMRVFLEGEGSFNRHATSNDAVHRLKRQIERSSGDMSNWFKEFTHEKVVPVWYRLLKKGFPPAKILTRMRNVHEEKEAIKLAKSLDDKSFVSDEEKLEIF